MGKAPPRGHLAINILVNLRMVNRMDRGLIFLQMGLNTLVVLLMDRGLGRVVIPMAQIQSGRVINMLVITIIGLEVE